MGACWAGVQLGVFRGGGEGLQEAGVETAVGTNPRPGAVLVAQCPLDPTAQPLDQVALGMTQWMDWRGGEGDWWPAVTPLLCP